MTEPCIMLADIDLIVDISSAYFVWRECPDRLLSCPVVTLCRYLTGLTFVHKTPRYVLIFLLTHCEYSMRWFVYVYLICLANLVRALFVYYLTSCWYLRNLSSRWGKKIRLMLCPRIPCCCQQVFTWRGDKCSLYSFNSTLSELSKKSLAAFAAGSFVELQGDKVSLFCLRCTAS